MIFVVCYSLAMLVLNCYAAVRIAEKKNRSQVGWFILTIIFPGAAPLVLLALDDIKLALCPLCEYPLYRNDGVCHRCGGDSFPVED